MKIKKRQKVNLSEIEVLCKWFGIKYKKPTGLSGYFQISKMKKQIAEKLKDLYKMLGIENVVDMNCHYATSREQTVFEEVITGNSAYRFILRCNSKEGCPTIEVKNDTLNAKYDYIRDPKKDLVRLSPNIIQYNTNKSLFILTTKETSKSKIVRISTQSENKISQMVYQTFLTIPNIGITSIEKTLAKLENMEIEEIHLFFEMLKGLLPTPIESLLSLACDIDMNNTRLYKIFQNGKMVQNTIWKNGNPIDLGSKRSKKKTSDKLN